MPIYEHKCKDCGKVIEVVHKIDEKPNLVCTKCGSEKLEKQVSVSTFSLKGTGWTPKYGR